ncbi:MAG: hypothetical protein PQJ60_03740, partial [Spirochaetales bacterium]|nr:hypothetical protein [Spirochaetales bacterium]
KVKESIKQEKALVLTTANLLRNIEDQLFIFLRLFLEELNLFDCEEMIIYAIRELAANANKANMKRLYFREKQLDIHNSEQYRVGMSSFKEDTFVDLEKYTKKLSAQGLYVKFRFHVKDDIFTITIMNNTALSREEEERINDKIRKAWDFASMAEAMAHILDGTEGAGLGLVSIIMMLRKIGIADKRALRIRKTQSETHSVVKIPYKNPILSRPATLPA